MDKRTMKCPKCGTEKTFDFDAIDATGKAVTGFGAMPDGGAGVGLTGHPGALAGLWGSAAEKPLIHSRCGVEMVDVTPDVANEPDEA